MNQTQANIDFCGIKNLLALLEKNGFSENELKQISLCKNEKALPDAYKTCFMTAFSGAYLLDISLQFQ